ncbi:MULTISPECIES: HNH endonuclease [Cytobacillus]|uniref:HNH endonuclease n=1 Tax=Cytobacillus TaxID=2675230 RepID=UPI0025A2BA7A|nr:HNH endonuclease signature motif containing protein [Cytobacillus kochii]MDM5208428.1 HNH endonuclease signature motif containing protein [Cytobacillus kochii]
MKYCDFNCCSNKISRGAYCDEHKRSKQSVRKKQKKKEIYHHENKSFYNSKLWKLKRSEVYQREKGCCQRCGKFVFGRRAHVHHVIPIKDDPTLKLEDNNLQLLCPKCHTEEENKDKEKRESVFPSYFG